MTQGCFCALTITIRTTATGHIRLAMRATGQYQDGPYVADYFLDMKLKAALVLPQYQRLQRCPAMKIVQFHIRFSAVAGRAGPEPAPRARPRRPRAPPPGHTRHGPGPG